MSFIGDVVDPKACDATREFERGRADETGTGGALNLDEPRFFRRPSSLLLENALLERCWTLGKPVDVVESRFGPAACFPFPPGPGFLSNTEPIMVPLGGVLSFIMVDISSYQSLLRGMFCGFRRYGRQSEGSYIQCMEDREQLGDEGKRRKSKGKLRNSCLLGRLCCSWAPNEQTNEGLITSLGCLTTQTEEAIYIRETSRQRVIYTCLTFYWMTRSVSLEQLKKYIERGG